jgi:hypothetical protein
LARREKSAFGSKGKRDGFHRDQGTKQGSVYFYFKKLENIVGDLVLQQEKTPNMSKPNKIE